ncbi:MAG TPA: ATP-dependent DNA ligase, partial [Candidatus Binataceae bacterium]|nr:ATP-dependent DNA ligase [Candidatus Binataceae bacterium]
MASFNDFALVCLALGQTQSRLQMAELAGEFLAHLDTAEAEIAARFMVGRALAQGEEKRLQISGRAIWKIVAAMTGGEDQGEEIFAAATDFGEAIEMLLRLRSAEPEPTLTLGEVERRFSEIAGIEGRNSRRRKLDALRELFERTTTLEGKYLAKVLIGEMRHGMSEGLMLEAIAKMAARPVAEVRRANMLAGDVGRVVRTLRSPQRNAIGKSIDDVLAPPPDDSGKNANTDPSADGPRSTENVARSNDRSSMPTRPLKPMLAQPAPNVGEAFRMLGDRIALEHKIDGARVQIHCGEAGVRIYSRALNEITPSLPEVVELAQPLRSRNAILDGEVIAIDAGGRPLAFQEVMRRFGRVRDIERLRVEQPVQLFVFDLIALDGNLLIDVPLEERYAALSDVADSAAITRAARIVPSTVAEGNQFYARAIADGYEGVVAKALASTYMPGARGRGWIKIKSARTLDLVIVAADWGYGRRHGWLSNYHLAARDERNGGFVEVGKTFKGLTDDDFREMTDRLIALKTADNRGTVVVRPEVVVEVAYSDIQRSSQYAGGMALRFARIVGVRSDKNASEADTIEAVAAAFDRQPVKPIPAAE